MSLESIKLIKGNGALYLQLYKEVKELILNGDLEDSYKLPPIRQLANLLKINNVTVINAYKLLEEEGLIIKKVGSGSYVNMPIGEYITEKMDFTGSDSNIDSFPLNSIRESLISVLKSDGVNIFKYENSDGYAPLKESLVNYFKYYNIETRPELIQIVSGGQQALDIISKALLDFGDTIIAETPTYRGAINIFTARDAKVIHLNLEHNGLDISEIESKVQGRKPRFIYIMPFNQKPTGITYSHNKKLQLLELANKYNFYIIEDDLGSELFDATNNKTLKSLDKNDKVIYIKSFTPLFMPGLRLGCIIPPEDMFQKIVNIKEMTDISTPGLIQRGFTNYINKNSWNSYYQSLSKNINSKITITTEVLEVEFKNLLTFNKNKNSPLFWLKLKKGDGKTLKNICHSKSIEIISGDEMGRDYSNYILLNIKSIPESNIKTGLRILKDLIESYYINI